MIKCKHTFSDIEAYVLGFLEPDESAVIKKHIEKCPSCSALEKKLKAEQDMFKHAVQTQPSADLTQFILARLNEKQKVRLYYEPSPKLVPYIIVSSFVFFATIISILRPELQTSFVNGLSHVLALVKAELKISGFGYVPFIVLPWISWWLTRLWIKHARM